MADTDLVSSNPLFEILEEWNEQLKHSQVDLLKDNEDYSEELDVSPEEPQP